MYNYKFGYYSFEESQYFELSNENKFSEEELTDMIAEVCKDLLNFEADKDKLKQTFQHFLESVREGLIKKYNFKEIEYESEWSVFGWADLLDEEDWKEESDETLKDLRKKIKETK